MTIAANYLSNKVAMVTGASRGIGLGIARKLAAAGCRVAICGRNGERLAVAEAELRSITSEIDVQAVDVAVESQVEQWFASVDERFGSVDLLVNNAGAFDGGHFSSLSTAAWSTVIDSSLTSAFLCSRAAFQRMERTGGGRILNIGSISAQRPRAGSAPYAAAKFGVWGLTQAIAIDGRPHGIVCSCLHPGNVLVERRQHSGSQADEEPMMSIETIAEAAFAMLNLPGDVNFLEAIVLPRDQDYLARG